MWDTLSSLESLVCPDTARISRNLRYCRSLSIKTQQTQPGLVYTDRGDGDLQDGLFQLLKPSIWASKALNSLVRLVLRRLPKNCLQTFR